MDALSSLGSFVTAGKADDQAFIDDLNARLSKYNIEFTGMLLLSFLDFRRKAEKSMTFFLFFRSPLFLSFFSLSLSPDPAGKDVGAPARFANGAALISRAITGMGLSATAVNFAPCLISCVWRLFFFFRRSSNKKKKKKNTHTFDFKKKKNSYQVTGVTLTSELVNFAPVGVSLTGVGTTIAPQGVAINPSVILIQPNA
jgi:hypothetical protein